MMRRERVEEAQISGNIRKKIKRSGWCTLKQGCSPIPTRVLARRTRRTRIGKDQLALCVQEDGSMNANKMRMDEGRKERKKEDIEGSGRQGHLYTAKRKFPSGPRPGIMETTTLKMAEATIKHCYRIHFPF
jgi:hypothetical protein